MGAHQQIVKGKKRKRKGEKKEGGEDSFGGFHKKGG